MPVRADTPGAVELPPLGEPPGGSDRAQGHAGAGGAVRGAGVVPPHVPLLQRLHPQAPPAEGLRLLLAHGAERALLLRPGLRSLPVHAGLCLPADSSPSALLRQLAWLVPLKGTFTR